MKISVDLDGTMWSHMSFFRSLFINMMSRGHHVGVLTGHNDDGSSQINDTRLMVSRNFPSPSFWFGRTPEYQDKNGAYYKSMVIKREGIDIHFDDLDFGNPETLRIFKQELGDEFYRLVIVQPREPHNVHYE